MTDSRKRMDSSTLETLIMLRINKSLWDERDVQWLIDHPRYFHEVDNDEEPHSQGSRRLRERDDDDDDYDVHENEDHNSRMTISTTSASSSSDNNTNNNSSTGRSRVLPASGWRPPSSGVVRNVRPRI